MQVSRMAKIKGTRFHSDKSQPQNKRWLLSDILVLARAPCVLAIVQPSWVVYFVAIATYISYVDIISKHTPVQTEYPGIHTQFAVRLASGVEVGNNYK